MKWIAGTCIAMAIAFAVPAHGKDQTQLSPAATTSNSNDAWIRETDVSEMDDSKGIYLRTRSMRQVADRRGRKYRPILWILCAEKNTGIVINFGGLYVAGVSSYGQVTWRTDQDKAWTYAFEGTSDNQALGLWGEDGVRLVKRLMGKTRFLVEATPVNERAVTMEFSLVGLDAKLPEIRQACGW